MIEGRASQVVRLVASTMVCAAACGFVLVYSSLSLILARQQRWDVAVLAEWVQRLRYASFIVPVAALILGLVAVRSEPKRRWVPEIFSGIALLFALAWPWLTLLAWLLSSIPAEIREFIWR